MRHQCGVVLLPARAGCPPLEEPDGVRSARHLPQRVEQQLAGPGGHVHRLPVHGRGRRLHQHPRPPAGHPAGQVGEEGLLGSRVGQPVVEVVVLGDDVHRRRPAEVVLLVLVAGQHEVRGHRNVGGEFAQDVALGPVVGQQLVGAEPGEVQRLGRVGHRRGDPRRQHLVEAAVVLRPEGGAPGVVQLVDRAVAVGQPAPEGRRAHVAVAASVVAAQLVADVPEPNGRVRAVAPGHLADQPQRVLAEDRRAGAPGLPAARPQRPALGVDRQDLRVRAGQPGRGSGGGGGQVDRDAALVQEREHLVEPAEVVAAGLRLQQPPGEHPERHEPDAGLRPSAPRPRATPTPATARGCSRSPARPRRTASDPLPHLHLFRWSRR